MFNLCCVCSLHQPTDRFTRWCRKRFEIDDIREANIYCDTNDCEIGNVEGTADEECRPEEGKSQEREVPTSSRASRKEGTSFAWKLPRGLRFSYSTIPNRPTAKRGPNPFSPSTVPLPRSRTVPTPPNRGNLCMSPITEEPVRTRVMRSMSSLGDRGLEESPDGRGWEREWEREEYNDIPSSPRVTINPPHPPWDDNSLPDQPYENPYYTLPIKDALWLPINPIGTLDLDMTVTMNVALTSEPGAGHLGLLSERLTSVGSVLSGLTADLESAISVSGDEISVNEPPPDGTEGIELTPTAASRLGRLSNDGDVSTADKQSDLLRTGFRPKRSGSVGSRHPGANLLTGSMSRLPLTSSPPSSPPGPPSPKSEVFPVPPSLLTGSLRSMSSGPLLKTVGSADRRMDPMSRSTDEGDRLAVPRPLQTLPPRRPSLNRVYSTNSISQNLFLPPPASGTSSRFALRSVISQASAQSVVIQEALNEETEVLQRSQLLLQEEAEKQNAPRSKWTSWAFKKRE